MRKLQKIAMVVMLVSLVSCVTTKHTKLTEYPEIYNEKPKTILFIPPVNHTTAANAKDLLRATIAPVLAEKGYYVLPIEPIFDFFKLNGAYSIAETTDKLPLKQFSEMFGADAVLKITIEDWDKNYYVVSGNVEVELLYELISTKSENTIWKRKKKVIVDTSSTSGGGGLAGLAANLVNTAVATASTKYVAVAKEVHIQALADLPKGYHSPLFMKDQAEPVWLDTP
jgi:hypothetical protein